jgi:hypothetical protein
MRWVVSVLVPLATTPLDCARREGASSIKFFIAALALTPVFLPVTS